MNDRDTTAPGVAARPAPPTRRFRILVVDDDSDSVDLLQRWLAMGGDDVSTAKDGAEALQAIAGQRPDLVLLDLLIPPPEGLQVIRTVKRDRAMSTVRIVVRTVKRDVKTKIEPNRTGADDFIVKPFHFDE